VVPASAVLTRAWLTMVLGSVVGLAITFGVMILLRVTELKPVTRRLRGFSRRLGGGN
jgi:putative peptidoglycan lipid II flippase